MLPFSFETYQDPKTQENTMTQDPGTNRIIDAHIHVWTADIKKYPLAPGFTKEDLWRPSFTPEEHFSYSRSVGAVRLNMVQMFWYGRDHSYILDLVASDPETYAASGLMELEDPEPERTMVALSQQRCFAFRLPASDFDHPAMAKMFAVGAEHNLALSFNMGVDKLPAMERMCERFPQTPVILDHVCHVGIGEPNYTEEQIGALLRFAKHQKVMVKIGPLQGLGARQAPYLDLLPLLERVVGAYGSKRCMWESDSGGPIWMSDPQTDFPAAIALIRDHASFLSESEREDLLFRTAEGVFFRR
jgi:predicted TIM-barrel fold metal-dependent hydrolase